MCGIFGTLGFNNIKVPGAKKTEEIIKSLVHRGPDDMGVFSKKEFTMGHSRLSIIDLEKGKQPMFSKNKRWVFSYNGEIYNYKTLKKNLQELGIIFETNSDTEVLLQGLIKFGYQFLRKVNGMFAFALFDSKKNELLLGRDHVGMKPLFYSLTSKYFVFASEPKAIFKTNFVPKKINKNVFFEYFCRGAPPYLQSFYKDVFELEPGTCLKIDTKKNLKRYTYYKIENGWQNIDKKELNLGRNEVLSTLEYKLTNSINSHLMSDVPIGLTLSGGLDSNIILDLLKKDNDLSKFKTFTYSTTGVNNEVKIVEKILKNFKNLKHKTVQISLKQQIKNVKKLSKYFDAPIAYPESLSLDKLGEVARNENFKVLICGQGADELFFGYVRYNYWKKKLQHIKDKTTWSNNLFFGMGINNVDLVENITGENKNIVRSSKVWKWVQQNWDLPIYKRMNIFDQKFRLLTLLKRDDITGMKNSVEYRLPYLDINLIDWVNALGDVNEFNKNLPKQILNEKVRNLISKKKLGSVSTIANWFNSNDFLKTIFKMIQKNESISKNYLNYDQVKKLFETKSTKLRSAFILKNLYFLELWFENEKNNI